MGRASRRVIYIRTGGNTPFDTFPKRHKPDIVEIAASAKRRCLLAMTDQRAGVIVFVLSLRRSASVFCDCGNLEVDSTLSSRTTSSSRSCEPKAKQSPYNFLKFFQQICNNFTISKVLFMSKKFFENLGVILWFFYSVSDERK